MVKASSAPHVVVTQTLERCIENVFADLRNQFSRNFGYVSAHGIDRARQVRCVAIGVGQIKACRRGRLFGENKGLSKGDLGIHPLRGDALR